MGEKLFYHHPSGVHIENNILRRLNNEQIGNEKNHSTNGGRRQSS